MRGDRILKVDCSSVTSNIATLRSHLPNECRLMAVVKANGYGIGLLALARMSVENGIEIVGVAHLEEAIALREAGFEQDIMAFHAWPEQAATIKQYGVEVGVSDLEMIRSCAEVGGIAVHLQLNTGIQRFGCRPQEAVALAETIAATPSLKFKGMMTHFAAADRPKEDPFTIGQASQFDAVVDVLKERKIHPEWLHVANSPAIVRMGRSTFTHYNMARPGIMLLGVHPSTVTEKICPLKQAITLEARVIKIHTCKKGETVSYGRFYTVEREEERIALLPIGYADGIQWRSSGKGSVLIHGKKAPMVGAICMDYMMINVTDIPEAKVGDMATLFGAKKGALSVEAYARQAGIIPHELITSIGPRIERLFLNKKS